MADVTGPINTLPGTVRSSPDGMMCDECDKHPATHRVQGETDSFGCEMEDLCERCFKKWRAEVKRYAAERACGVCDWCRKEATDLRSARDYDEGMAGPIYEVCGACIRKRSEEAAEEAKYWDRGDDYDEYDDGQDDWKSETADPRRVSFVKP